MTDNRLPTNPIGERLQGEIANDPPDHGDNEPAGKTQRSKVTNCRVAHQTQNSLAELHLRPSRIRIQPIPLSPSRRQEFILFNHFNLPFQKFISPNRGRPRPAPASPIGERLQGEIPPGGARIRAKGAKAPSCRPNSSFFSQKTPLQAPIGAQS